MKTFVQLSKSWYGEANLKEMSNLNLVDEICVNFNKNEAGIVLSWVKLSSGVSCKVEMFSDSWKAFTAVPELFSKLSELNNPSHKKDISPNEMASVLKKLGFKDMTETNRK